MKRPLIALAVLFIAACTGQTGSPTSASPAPGDYSAPPAGVPLFFVQDFHHAGWYIGIDWTGKPRGTIKLSEPLQPVQRLLPAPDGSAFMIQPLKGTWRCVPRPARPADRRF